MTDDVVTTMMMKYNHCCFITLSLFESSMKASLERPPGLQYSLAFQCSI